MEKDSSDRNTQTTLLEVCEEEKRGYSGKSIKEMYFLDLAHTRELYKDFDLKLQILYIMVKHADSGIDIKKISRLLGLGGSSNHLNKKIKDILCFWSNVGLVRFIYDYTIGTMPNPKTWICNDVEGAKELLRTIIWFHTQIVGKAIKNNSLEMVSLSNTNPLYCIPLTKKT